jgi:hypothetical protein
MNGRNVHTALALILLVLSTAVAQEPAAEPKGRAASEEALAYFRQQAGEYVITAGSDGDKRLTLRPEPILHWGNPARNGEDGAMFVWVHEGRPEVAGTVFTFQIRGQERMKHELISLSDEPLRAEFKGQLAWAPEKPGPGFQPIESAPEPAGTPRQRLTQMRQLVREYSANLTDREGTTHELRLMTQPLYRYQPERPDVIDGALFAFVTGTDPEVLLMIEARRRDNDRMEWVCGFLPCHYVTLRARRGDQQVWEAPPQLGLMNARLGDVEFQKEIHLSFYPNRSGGRE